MLRRCPPRSRGNRCKVILSGRLQFPPFGDLAAQQERFRKLPFTADLERAEVLEHQSPNVRRASSPFIRSCSSGRCERASRSASSKNRFLSCALASSPDSMRSTMILLALVRLVLARVFTRRATRGDIAFHAGLDRLLLQSVLGSKSCDMERIK